MIVVAPACLVLWERFSRVSVIGGVVLAGGIDALSISLDQPLIGHPNSLLVRASFQQVGFAWLDGRLAGPLRRPALDALSAARAVHREVFESGLARTEAAHGPAPEEGHVPGAGAAAPRSR